MIFQLKKLVTKTGAGNEAYCTKTGAVKEAYCIKTGAGKGYLWILVQAKQCSKLASKASQLTDQSRVGGKDSSLAIELGWR